MVDDTVVVFVRLRNQAHFRKGVIRASESLGIMFDIKPNSVVKLSRDKLRLLEKLYGSTHEFIVIKTGVTSTSKQITQTEEQKGRTGTRQKRTRKSKRK